MSTIAEIISIHTPPGTIGHLQESGASRRIPFFDQELPIKKLPIGQEVTFDLKSDTHGNEFATNLQKHP